MDIQCWRVRFIKPYPVSSTTEYDYFYSVAFYPPWAACGRHWASSQWPVELSLTAPWPVMPSGEQKKENNPSPLSLNNRTYFPVARARDKMSGMVQDPAGHLRMVARMGLQPSSSRAQAALGRYGTHGALAPTSCPLCLWNLTPISHIHGPQCTTYISPAQS